MQERCTIACAIHEGLIKVQNVELFEKRKLLNIAMKSLLRTSGSVSSGLGPNTSGEYLPSKIDNEVDTQRIAENFGEKYRLLYTKVPTDPMEIETLSNELYSLCVNCNMRECRVTALDVRKAIRKLKRGKSDGIDGFMSDHIIHASDKFCVIVGMLINAMLTHGHNPSQLLNIVVKSIPIKICEVASIVVAIIEEYHCAMHYVN